MLGLRVQVRGCAPIVAALTQKKPYLVSAGASWRRKSRRSIARSSIHGTGMDDRDDHLRWLSVQNPPRGSWIDIAVVDASIATAPRRLPRPRMDWRSVFAAIRGRERARIADLQVRLDQVRSG